MVETRRASSAGRLEHVRGDPLPWLLEPANLSARYLTLRHLLGRPDGDADAAEARAGILGAEPAASILAAQWPAGYWVTPDRGYTPRYRATVWQVIFLAQLGAPLDERIERAWEFLWQHSRRADGLFTPHRRPHLLDLANLNGRLLWALAQFGYAGDPRTDQLLDAVAALDLSRLFRADSLAALVSLARGLHELPGRQLPARLRSFLGEAARFVADHLPPEAGSAWLRFGFPVAERTDLLEMLALVQPTGVAREPRLASALAVVISKQDEGGRWPLEAIPGKMWASVGEPGMANKWVTIRALRVLRASSEEA